MTDTLLGQVVAAAHALEPGNGQLYKLRLEYLPGRGAWRAAAEYFMGKSFHCEKRERGEALRALLSVLQGFKAPR